MAADSTQKGTKVPSFMRDLPIYPGMDMHIKRGVAVSIDGKIYRDQWDTELPAGAEIYLMPRVPGG